MTRILILFNSVIIIGGNLATPARPCRWSSDCLDKFQRLVDRVLPTELKWAKNNSRSLSWQFWKFYQKYFWAWQPVTALERPNVGLQNKFEVDFLANVGQGLWCKVWFMVKLNNDLWLTFDLMVRLKFHVRLEHAHPAEHPRAQRRQQSYPTTSVRRLEYARWRKIGNKARRWSQ